MKTKAPKKPKAATTPEPTINPDPRLRPFIDALADLIIADMKRKGEI